MRYKSISSQKESSRSLFYRVSAWLHLWLGLVTGIVMVIVCLTGCIWVFQEEITNLIEPETTVPYQNKPVLRPSQVMAIAATAFPGKEAAYAMYRQGHTIEATIGGRDKAGGSVNINPYTGQIVSVKKRQKGQVDFFRWVLNGHRALWLPYPIGRPIVNYSTLIFIITLITGMVLWWPQKWTKSTRDRSFTIRWNGSAKRVNYDLHNVLGFYSLLVVMAISVTGIVFGIEWFSKGLYWTTTGGRTMPEHRRGGISSDTLQPNRPYTNAQAIDLAWETVARKHPESKGFFMTFPSTNDQKGTIDISAYPSAGKFYDRQGYHFDRYSVAPIAHKDIDTVPFARSDFGDKLRRMNYDIHVGTILGLPGKVLAFFASLIGASLPITGFIIWWGKGKKKGKKNGKKAKSKLPVTAVDEAGLTPAFRPGQRQAKPVFTPTTITSASSGLGVSDQ
jgi:uncharacterized iron-regulated membrane protein